MHRLISLSPWRRHFLQFGLLAGTGLAFVGGEPSRLAAAPRDCAVEGECTFKKPLLLFVLEASAAMNEAFDAESTRWEVAVETLSSLVEVDNGYFAGNFILGLERFGHDPDPNQPGTLIPGDTTGLVDGHKLDVPWYDPNDPDKAYGQCDNGDAIVAALAALPAPQAGVGAWTRGAIEFAADYHAVTFADHPEDMGDRKALLMVLTTGRWTDPTGALPLAPPEQDPVPAVSDLWVDKAVPTYVLALGAPEDLPLADALAVAGGTGQALGVAELGLLYDALAQVIQNIVDSIIQPVCTPGYPRFMVLLDASSSMLNLPTNQAPPGQGAWDQARDALTGTNSIFDHIVAPDASADTRFHFGLSVFGDPDEARLLVQYGPCRKDHFAWALDPESSCVAPDCVDPYAGPPIAWTFQDGSLVEPPGFGTKTLSHVPRCDKLGDPQICTGSGSYVHAGLEQVQANLETYRAECKSQNTLFPCNDNTSFINVLITDGAYDSTDAQVSAPLIAMHADGVVTRVIGFGGSQNTDQLAAMADWGSGGTLEPILAADQSQLEAALAGLLSPPENFDPCCVFLECSTFVDTDGDINEPDSTSTDGDTSSTGDSSTGGSGGTGDSSSGGGDDTAPLDSNTGTAGPDSTGPGESGPADPDGTAGPDLTSGAPEPTVPTSGGPGPADPGASDSEADSEGVWEASDKAGCGCRSTGPGGAPALLLLGLLGRRRRRR